MKRLLIGNVGGWPLACVLALLVSNCLLVPERGYVGERAANSRPHCQITGGVLVDTTDPALAEKNVQARVHFYWFGSDNDGLIRWFEWAVDDTISEGAWHETINFDEIISFDAKQRTTGEDFADWHTFFIRSVDDQYGRSRPDRRFFNAHTIAPESEITGPEQHTGTPTWARTLRIKWKGEDTDGSRADGLPAWFEYKWVNFGASLPQADQLALIRSEFANRANLFLVDSLSRNDFPDDGGAYYASALKEWIRVPGTESEVWLENMVSGQKYGFVVRAIDEAGAMEPDLNSENWALFTATDRKIIITVSEPALGRKVFAGSLTPWEVDVVPGQTIRFEWTGDASDAGADPGPSNYAFDILYPDREVERSLDGMGGWIGWGMRLRMDRSVSFPPQDEGLEHKFYLKMRDVSGFQGTETLCPVEIKVVRFSFHKKFLIVDDIGRLPRSCISQQSAPTDAVMDAWTWDPDGNSVFESIQEHLAESEEPGHYTAFGAGDNEELNTNQEAFFDSLVQYQTLIWISGAIESNLLSTFGSGDSPMDSYIGAGGNILLLADHGPVSMIVGFPLSGTDEECPATTAATGDLVQPWDSFSFLYTQLHLRGCVNSPHDFTSPLFHAGDMTGARAENQIYPDLKVDPQRYGCSNKGVWQYEVLWDDQADPYAPRWYEEDPNLEILYRTQTLDPGSEFNDRPVAYRIKPNEVEEDDAGGLPAGRVVVFSFHPYYFEQGAVKTTMTLALRWALTGSEF
ncbi:MAG: hypothetical protein V1774_08310 [Candidatus Eisenbacteria bacterium]